MNKPPQLFRPLTNQMCFIGVKYLYNGLFVSKSGTPNYC